MRLLIAGGGTGGHVYPAIAIAEEFLGRRISHQVLFVGTQKGLEGKVLPKKKYPFETIFARGWMGKSPFEKIKTFLVMTIAVVQSLIIIIRFKPDFVLGMGGYASFPVLLASILLFKRRGIHEQNMYPGLANRVLARFCHKILVSFDASKEFFPPDKTSVTGNPVRKFKGIVRGDPSAQGPRGDSKQASRQFTVFIFGGSQGAHSLNRAMLNALPFLSDIKDSLHIIHQTGKTDINWVESTYFQQQWRVEAYNFIYDIEPIFAKADYIICRAGASSLVELAFLKKACLLIPYPHAAHNHQELNARMLEKQQAARVLLDWQLDGAQLAKEITWAFTHPRELESMQKKILQFSQPYAANAIVDIIMAEGAVTKKS